MANPDLSERQSGIRRVWSAVSVFRLSSSVFFILIGIRPTPKVTCAKLSVDPRVAELCRASPVSCLNRDGGGEGQGSLKDGDYCKFAVCLFFACAISSIFTLPFLC